MLDLALAVLFMLFSPVLAGFIKHPLQFFKNILTILFGLHSWVGYQPVPGDSLTSLPRLKPGILTPAFKLERTDADRQVIEKINMLYAKDYTLWNDLTIIWKGFRQLGSRPGISDTVPPVIV
jgi:lipopolysaccharide/colanic/teichoic acid biosynthesis glycosyltransferase